MSTTSGIGSHLEQPYILDIDLDYFMTYRAVMPQTTTVFYEMIRHAIGITIARESRCIEDLRLEGEHIDANQLQEMVMHHIITALY